VSGVQIPAPPPTPSLDWLWWAILFKLPQKWYTGGSKMAYLLKRMNTYYFRVKVPKDFRSYFPVREIRKSLKTPIRKNAKLLSTGLSFRTERLFATIGAEC
jgi:hypothetical protein